jgi:hypothetical protein
MGETTSLKAIERKTNKQCLKSLYLGRELSLDLRMTIRRLLQRKVSGWNVLKTKHQSKIDSKKHRM